MAEEVSGEPNRHWDEPGAMDPQTSQKLSFAGVGCRVIGTFFFDLVHDDSPDLALRFGSDLSNYYPNQGLTVYKPNDNSLKKIVNYQDIDRLEDLTNQTRVPIGEVRYASTNRALQGISNVEMSISPVDLLQQKTALFGMTRTGKSNTTKIIAKSVFNLRSEKEPLRIGQIIFDPDGEYANENVQDNKTALKNVWESKNGEKEDVVTYGILPHPNDSDRKLMRINFYNEDMLQIGKEIINEVFVNEGSIYIRNFVQVKFDKPSETDHSAMTRYRRRVLAYRTLLKNAGFAVSPQLNPDLRGLFSNDLLNTMRDTETNQEIVDAAEIFAMDTPTWDSLAIAFESLNSFIKTDSYREFNRSYISRSSSGESWADPDLVNILAMFEFPAGANQMGQARNRHTEKTNTDFAEDIYSELKEGKLVIIDQSSGEPEVNESSAERIMWRIFRENQGKFRENKDLPDILIYIEEAHNLLPHGSESDLKNVWVRTAKEGGKYSLGMVCITQEVSSIQKNILKNTANWFIGHLNNTDETRELCKFYDFADFEKSILRAQDRGFVRVKTLSNPFVVPVQIKKFEV